MSKDVNNLKPGDQVPAMPLKELIRRLCDVRNRKARRQQPEGQ